MRQKDLKYFGDLASGRMNSDDSPFAITTNEWVNAQNVRSGSTDKGATGIIESIGGNLEIEKPNELSSIIINNQKWTLQDLNVEFYKNGEAIPEVTDPTAWAALTTGARCWYNNDPNTGIMLYNWYAVNDPRGLAPNGWWIPTQYEWQQLSDYLGGDIVSGGHLKETGFTHWDSPNTGADNSSGFTALGNGNRDIYGNYINKGQVAAFWTSTQLNDDIAISISLNNTNSNFFVESTNLKKGGFSVRALTFNPEYITIGSIEDTENKRFVYFDCDIVRNHQASIPNIELISIGTDVLTTLDSRISLLNIGDVFIITSGVNRGTYTCNSIDYIDNNGYEINIGVITTPDIFITDIIYTSSIGEDKIVCMYTDTNIQYNVLLSSEVIGGLNFNKNSLIHSAHIANNILSFPDGTNNEPRKFNIESAIKANYPSFVTDEKAYSFPLNFNEITLIKPPPILSPNIIKATDINYYNNFIANESFEFAFQYKYNDNENTVIGAYSTSSKLNYPNDTFNKITVTMDGSEKIPNTVSIVYLIVRLTNGITSGSNSAFVVKKWDKKITKDLLEINAQNNNSNVLTFDFYNDILSEAIPENDVLRPFDNVPIYSQTHEIAKQRYFLANNIDGYDSPYTSSLNCELPNHINIENTNKSDRLYNVFLASAGSGLNHYIEPSKRWAFRGYLIWDSFNNQTGWFEISTTSQYHTGTNSYISPLPAPTGISYNVLIYRGNTLSSASANIRTAYAPIGDTYIAYFFWDAMSSYVSITTPTSNKYNIFSPNSKYNVGIVFYDYAMRKCGVFSPENKYLVTVNTFSTNISSTSPHTLIFSDNITEFMNPSDIIVISGGTSLDGTYTIDNIINEHIVSLIETISTTGSSACSIDINRYRTNTIITPKRNYNYTVAVPYINWKLSNNDSINEIPSWAYYYSIVKTLNLKTRFFIQSLCPTGTVKYASKNANGIYEYNSNIWQPNSVAIALPTDALRQSGLGYVYAEGDVCILTSFLNNTYELPVIGQDGNYILLKAKDIGTVSYSFAYEIYTPYKSQTNEPYYEVGEIYKIANPTKSYRKYTTTEGILNSDCFLFQRSFAPSTTYKSCAMCPNDLYYKRWDTDAGKPNIVTDLGQVNNNTEILWSDTYISGTKINGSSTFRLGSQDFVSDDCGSITKLQNTSKVLTQQGSVMLALCTTETNSLYLGETQILDSTGATQFFSAGTSTIGTINILKGNYGCIDPASVVQYRGNVYFFDANNGRWVQYSANGLDNIAAIKMSRFWKNWSYKYMSMTKAEIEAFGNRPYVFATVDPGHDELLITIPRLSYDPPKGYLPDYPAKVYPFDILDYTGKTISYKLGTGAIVQPHWQSAYTFTTEYFCTIQNRLFSFKEGNAWEHNQETQNTFYGLYSPSQIMFTSNILPQMPKVYDNFLSESNLIPNFVYFYNEFPYLQTSDLLDTDFVEKEGIWYAQILRNKVVPTNSGDVYTGLLTAEVMRNTNMYVLAEYSPTTSPLQLRIIQLGMSISRGHLL